MSSLTAGVTHVNLPNVRIPDFYSTSDLEVFIDELKAEGDKYGARKILKSVHMIYNHLKRIEEHKAVAMGTIERIKGHTARAFNAKAYDFYNDMSDAQLDKYCDMFNLKADVFNGRDEMIAALIKAHSENEEDRV